MLKDNVSGKQKNMKTVVNAVIPANSHNVAAQVFQRVLYKVVSRSNLIEATSED